MSDHNPGPWRVDEYENSFDVFACDEGSSYVAGCVKDNPRAAANAKLIAAAPDMLTALRKIEDHFDMDGYGPDAWKKLAHEMADVARTAIRKATQP